MSKSEISFSLFPHGYAQVRTWLMPFLLLVLSARAYAGSLPVIYIDTPGSSAITSRDKWTKGCRMRIVMPDGTEDFCSSDVDVKGRGHSNFTLSLIHI